MKARVFAEGKWSCLSTDLALREQYRIHGFLPQAVARPRSLSELAELLAHTTSEQAGTVVWGLGARQSQLPPAQPYHLALSLRSLRRVLRYEPADLTVTVEAGCTVAELETVLAERGQWLGCEPALPQRTTIGGLIAAAADGPLRARFGRVRDALIGVGFLQSDGTLVRAGGQVVKNVAGYDLMKLLVGSWGTLGVITEATFRLRPRPAAQALYLRAFEAWDEACARAVELTVGTLEPALVALLAGRALPRLVAEPKPHLVVALCGYTEEIQRQIDCLRELVPGGMPIPHTHPEFSSLWSAIRDFPLRATSGAVGVRASLLPTSLPQLLPDAAAQTLAATGSLAAWMQSGSVFARFPAEREGLLEFWLTTVRHRAEAQRGLVWVDLWHPILARRGGPAWYPAIDSRLAALQLGIKQTLDPRGILSPARFPALGQGNQP